MILCIRSTIPLLFFCQIVPATVFGIVLCVYIRNKFARIGQSILQDGAIHRGNAPFGAPPGDVSAPRAWGIFFAYTANVWYVGALLLLLVTTGIVRRCLFG